MFAASYCVKVYYLYGPYIPIAKARGFTAQEVKGLYMSRTPDQVAQSIIAEAAILNASIQVDTGPIFDSMIGPVSNEFSTIEAEVEHLSQLYSTTFIQTASDADIEAYITNFALPEGNGSYASGNCQFATYTRLQPGETITIPVGALVSTSDNSIVYQVTAQRIMYGDTIDSYYNASNTWYEISAPVESVSSGNYANIPSLRITKLLTTIASIDIVTNKSPISGGIDAQDNVQKFQRIEDAFLGQDSGSQNGIIKLVANYAPETITAVAIVRSSDHDLFLRFVNQLALDVYVLGQNSQLIQEENYTLTTSTNYIILNSAPVLDIVSVSVNGVAYSYWQLELDTGVYAGSNLSQDKLVFNDLFFIGTIITVSYNYNYLMTDLKTNVFAANQDNLMDMDILVRQMLQQSIVLQGTIIPASSANVDTVIGLVQDQLYLLIENNINGYQYIPETVRQNLISTVSGLTDFIWYKFTTATASYSNIEIITLPKNTIGRIDSTNFLINS